MLASICLIASVVTFYAWAWDWTPALEGDSASYLAPAVDLQDGSLDHLHPRSLGYPAFLVLTGSAPVPGVRLLVAQLLLHVLAVALMAHLLVRLRVGHMSTLAFVVVSLLPPFVEHAGFVLTESLTQLCVVTGLVGFSAWLLDGRALWLAVASIALAAVGLVHPSDQLLWLVMPALALISCATARGRCPSWRRVALGGGVISGVSVVVLGAMIAWNVVRFDFAGISPMLGATLSHKTVRVVEQLPEEYVGVREILIRYRDAALLDPVTGHLGLAYIFRAMPELEAKTGLEGPALSRYLVRMNLALIRRAPMDYVDEVLRSAVWYWAPGVTDRSGFGITGMKAAFNGLRSIVLVAFWGTVALLVGPSVMYVIARRQRLPGGGFADEPALDEALLVIWLILGTTAYSMVVSTALTAAVYRLRIPVDLPILATAVVGPGIWRSLRRRHFAEPPV